MIITQNLSVRVRAVEGCNLQTNPFSNISAFSTPTPPRFLLSRHWPPIGPLARSAQAPAPPQSLSCPGCLAGGLRLGRFSFNTQLSRAAQATDKHPHQHWTSARSRVRPLENVFRSVHHDLRGAATVYRLARRRRDR